MREASTPLNCRIVRECGKKERVEGAGREGWGWQQEMGEKQSKEHFMPVDLNAQQTQSEPGPNGKRIKTTP